MYFYDITCPPGHHHDDLMATGALFTITCCWHSRIQCVVKLLIDQQAYVLCSH